MAMTSKYKNSKTAKEHLKTPNAIEEVFSWLPEFHKVIRSSTESRNYQHLEDSLLLYIENILSSVKSSDVKFGDNITYLNLCSLNLLNLKNHINNMLIFFHLYWLDIKQDIADHLQDIANSYLNKMSALLKIYIDMELKTSHVRDSSEIAAKIFAALYIYLNNSEEHIFKVLLKIKHMEKYKKICNHIFMKSFTNLKTKMKSIKQKESITDVAYVRYLFAFKIWKEMEESAYKKKKIDFLIMNEAVMLLGPRMPKLRDELKFVPRPPQDEKNETRWLLHSNLKHTFELFLLFEDRMDNLGNLKRTKTDYIDQNFSKFQKHQINSVFRRNNSSGDTSKQEISRNHLEDLQNHNMISSISGNKSFKKNNKKAGQIKPKRNKVIFIDITEDEIKEKVKRKKTELGYLRIMEENIKKKHINRSKSSQLINKKSSNKGSKKSVKSVCCEYKPISNNKVSDSTRSYTSNSSKSSLNDVCHNFQKNKHPSITKNQMSSTRLDFGKEDEMQHDYNSLYLKSPMFVDQNTKELKVEANVLKKSKPENHVSSHMTYVTGNVINSYNNPVMQNKEALTSQEESAMETISLFKMCQNSNAEQHSFKQELPTSTDCSVMQKTQCITVPVDVHVYVVNHIGERIMPMHAEKRVQCLDKSNDTCTVSTTFTGDQIVKPSLYSQHFDNARMNDYGNVVKYSEITMKEQQERSECDSSILNDRIHSSEPYDINSFDEMMNTDCFLNNVQSDALEDFFRQCSAMPQINYDDSNDLSIKKSLAYIDNDVTAIKAQDTLHNMFTDNENDMKPPYDTNIIYMLNDHDKCVYLSNHTDERLMTTNAEKKAQYLDNSSDMCVSTTFTGDHIVESSLDFDNRKYNYEDGSKHFEVTMMEQQEKNDCDASISNDRLHLSEPCAFDIDSFEIDSKEANEIMKIDCIDDSENISLSHNMQLETLETLLSNTTDFLSLKQSIEQPFENTDAFSNKKEILCNNQNNIISSSLNPVAYCVNNGNIYLRLPAKSDKSVFQEAAEFRYSS